MNDKRRSKRLDYKVLHNTGEKVEKLPVHAGEESTTEDTLLKSLENLTIYDSGSMAEFKQLIATEATLSDDVDDFIQENPIEDIGSCIDDYDAINKKAEELRTVNKRELPGKV